MLTRRPAFAVHCLVGSAAHSRDFRAFCPLRPERDARRHGQGCGLAARSEASAGEREGFVGDEIFSLFQAAYTRNWRFAFGFASVVILSAGGEVVLNFIAASEAKDAAAFSSFLEQSATRAHDLEALKRGEKVAFLEKLAAELRARMARVRE